MCEYGLGIGFIDWFSKHLFSTGRTFVHNKHWLSHDICVDFPLYYSESIYHLLESSHGSSCMLNIAMSVETIFSLKKLQTYPLTYFFGYISVILFVMSALLQNNLQNQKSVIQSRLNSWSI